MLQMLLIMIGFAILIGILWFLTMRATPKKGVMRVIEHICMGIILCYLCSVFLSPLGIHFVDGPISALSAGYLGLPGVALSAIAQLWP